MQIIFDTNHEPIEFSSMNSDLFPDSPNRCPLKDCLIPVKLKKHGFYKRFFIGKSFTGYIFIRRYICTVCGKTVSMLPMFCIPFFQYSALNILDIFYQLYLKGTSLNSLIGRLKKKFPSISRRHVNFYRKRIALNRRFIQYVLNRISPEFIFAGNIPEIKDWIRVFLEIVIKIHPHRFLNDFSHLTGKSFLTSNFMIA